MAKPHLKNLDLPKYVGAPEPTVFQGGVERMIKIFNDLREENTGAYGSGVCGGISGWGIKGRSITSCSPFTATVIGILFDPNGTVGGACNPTYNNGADDLPKTFYAMHNGNFHGKLPKGVKGVNSSAESLLYYNLAYEIQPKDLRRGDMVGIDWSGGGGHAVFVWDVHLDDKQFTDAFCFVSSNGKIQMIYDPADPAGPKKHLSRDIDPKTKKNKARKVLEKNCYGVGISIGGVGTQGKDYFNNIANIKKVPAHKRKDVITPKKTIFVDRPEHIKDAGWHAIPGKSKGSIDLTTWKECDPKHPPTIAYSRLARIRCVRFWGFPPPENRDGESEREIKDFLLAKEKAKYPMPPSYATGTGAAAKPTLEAEKPATAKGDVEKVKNAAPKLAEQPKKPEKFTAQQLWVEDALGAFFDHDWLETDPGDRKNPNDAESKKAIKEFQEKWKLSPADGVARPEHRKVMEKAFEDLLKGDEPPHKKPPPAQKTKLERVVWLRNRVESGEPLYFALHGIVTQINRLNITFTCRKSKKTATIPCDVDLDANNILEQPIGIPKTFENGSELLASFSGTAKDGVTVKFDSKVPVYVGRPVLAILLE